MTYRKVSELVPYAMNARTHSESQVQQIVGSIKLFGFINPVLIDGNSEIIAGHGRVLAAQVLEMEKVPCIVLTHLTEGEQRALVLADNRIQLSAGWDVEKLQKELGDLTNMDFDLSLTGFTQHELDTYLKIDEGIIPDLDMPVERVPVSSMNESYGEGEGRKVPEVDEYAELEEYQLEQKPKVSDDEYSNFELVMVHENKVRLVEVLNEIKTAKGYTKTEEAMMELIEDYEKKSER